MGHEGVRSAAVLRQSTQNLWPHLVATTTTMFSSSSSSDACLANGVRHTGHSLCSLARALLSCSVASTSSVSSSSSIMRRRSETPVGEMSTDFVSTAVSVVASSLAHALSGVPLAVAI